jgi:hypothetical protein
MNATGPTPGSDVARELAMVLRHRSGFRADASFQTCMDEVALVTVIVRHDHQDAAPRGRAAVRVRRDPLQVGTLNHI